MNKQSKTRRWTKAPKVEPLEQLLEMEDPEAYGLLWIDLSSSSIHVIPNLLPV